MTDSPPSTRRLDGTLQRLLLLVLLFTVLLVRPAVGQNVGDAVTDELELVDIDVSTLSVEDREALLDRLTDGQVRSLFLELWEKQESARESKSLVEIFRASNEIFATRFVAALGAWRELADIPGLILKRLNRTASGASDLLLYAIAILGIAGLLEWLTLRFLTGRARRAPQQSVNSYAERFARAFRNFFDRTVGLLVFVLVAFVIYSMLEPESAPVARALITLTVGVVMVRALITFSAYLLSPEDQQFRLVRLEDAHARRMHQQGVILFVTATSLYLLLDLLFMFGYPPNPLRLYVFLSSTLVTCLLVVFAWRVREPVAELLTARRRNVITDAIASNWYLLFTVVVILIYAISVHLRVSGFAAARGATLGTYLVLLVLPVVLATFKECMLDREWQRQKLIEAGESPRESILEVLIDRGGRFLIFIVALLAIAWMWGVNPFALAESQLGGRAFSALLTILVAIGIGYSAWAVVSKLMEPYMPSSDIAGPGDEGGGTGASRISTLMPLFQKFLLITISVITLMVVLSSIGVDIGPLIAGAGVVGIAIGFGAQTLVRDIISGVFFLADDAFRKGEYIAVGDVTGTVERISLRSFQLRHHNGPIHTVPYGEIQHLTNYSRDWAIMKFEVRVPFETDVEKVRKLIKKVGQKMMEDPDHAPLLLEPLKSQGVNRMDDSAFIVRCKFTAHPGHQFVLRRVAFGLIQQAFEEHGIPFAPRRVLVETVPGRIADDVAAAGAAAVASQSTDTSAPANDRG